MEEFYSITSKEILGENWKFIVKINPKHSVYQGHFPGFEIVPGVVLIQMIKELVESELHQKLKLKEAQSIKFLKMVLPSNASEIEVILTVRQKDNIEVKGEMKINNSSCFKISALF